MTTSTSSKTDVIDHDVMLAALRQLICHVEPFIHDAATAEQAEEALIHLEENDKRFHKYDLVRLVRSSMEDKLGHLIEEEIEHGTVGHTQTVGQDTLVEKIVDKIVNSQQYIDVIKLLKSSSGDCLDQLSHNFDEEFRTATVSNTDMVNMHVRHSYSFSDEESSFGSSLNQSSFMFMNQEQFHQIAGSLDKKKTLSVRRQALKTLLQVPPMDIQGSEQWSLLRRGILDALSDSDDQLFNLSLNFCAKGFSSSSPHTREIYSTLVEHLILQFNSRKSSLPKLQQGLDVTGAEVSRALLACRLLHDFQVRISSYWVRQSPKFLDEILESTLQLLSVRHSSVAGMTQISPIHLFSLLDPKATWFVKWMHGYYSRQPLLTMLQKYRAIVDTAVKHCLNYVHANLQTKKSTEDGLSQALSKEHIGDISRCKYSGDEVEFTYFIHSISLVGKLLFYKDGRSFFPVKVKDPDAPVTISKFLVSMIGLIHSATSPPSGKQHALFDPVELVVDLLKKQCVSEQSLDVCLCQDDVMLTLLSPITQWINGTVPSVKDPALLHIADILSMVAASNRGREQILYGWGKDLFSANESSSANTIARFTRLALEEKLTNQSAGFPSRAVIGAFMYTCRQLYSDCPGLMVMSKHDIFTLVSTSWKEACREAEHAATPTPSDNSGSAGIPSKNKESQHLLLWEDALRDNLLNFAGTPRGVLLLQLTLAMDDCVSYMYTRYAKKLQVSRCEKFGYGFMLTQVAATSPGMVALQNTGFMEALVTELWYTLEASADGNPAAPKVWPLQPIDRNVHKPMISLFNVLSAFPAVYELLVQKSLPSKDQYSLREVPSNLVELIDRLVMVDTTAKYESLFNYEQSHVFGLRLLSVLVSSLDTCLLLEAQYKFQNFLFTSQEQNIAGEDKSREIIVDMLSVERNYILVKSYLVGGPTERLLPARSLSEDLNSPYPYPMFGKLPIPQQYTPTQNASLKAENELSKFLTETKSSEHNSSWLDKCKKAFCGVLSTKPEQATVALIQELLERAVPVLTQNADEAVFPLVPYSVNESAVKSINLSSMTTLGVQYTIRYGQHLKLLQSGSPASEKLTHLHKQIAHFLSQTRKSIKTQFRYSEGPYKGYDWFTSTIFLIMAGSKDKSWKLLHKMSALLASAYIWPARAHCSSHIREDLCSCGVPPLFYSTGHAVELLLQTEHSSVFSAFRMSGYTPSQICQHWFTQCLWNYLDWLEICHYVCICLLLGADYQVYVCVALLKHLQSGLLRRMQNEDLMIFLKEEAIPNFKLGNHLEYMQQLETKYRKLILPNMLSIVRS